MAPPVLILPLAQLVHLPEELLDPNANLLALTAHPFDLGPQLFRFGDCGVALNPERAHQLDGAVDALLEHVKGIRFERFCFRPGCAHAAAFSASAALAWLTRASNAGRSLRARSARTFRLSSMPAFLSPFMNRL